MSKFKAKNREEERASGISPEIQEIDTLLDELCEKEEEAKNKPSNGNKKQSLQKEQATAEEMRLKVMETMGQTQKCSGSSKEKQEKYRQCYWILVKESRRRAGIKKRRN